MPKAIEIETARLRLRQWRESDRAPFAAMNADAGVMEFLASLQSREASDASIDAWQSQFAERGWSNWAVEVRSSSVFIGFVGLSVPKRVLPFSPCVEVGWRLARPYWGQGYATEGARAALRVGFERLELAEIVSFTSVLNSRSRAVMERIGMRNAHEDFEYPGVPENPLCDHTACIESPARSGARMPARRFDAQRFILSVGGSRRINQEAGTVTDLFDAIPYCLSAQLIPPLHVVNDLLRRGVRDAGMSGGCEWKPFEITHPEWVDLANDLKARTSGKACEWDIERECRDLERAHDQATKDGNADLAEELRARALEAATKLAQLLMEHRRRKEQ